MTVELIAQVMTYVAPLPACALVVGLWRQSRTERRRLRRYWLRQEARWRAVARWESRLIDARLRRIAREEGWPA
jgi:hypothetical protein